MDIFVVDNFVVKPEGDDRGETEIILLIRLEGRTEAIHIDLNSEEIDELRDHLEPYNPKGLTWNTFMRMIKKAVTPHTEVKDKGKRFNRLPTLLRILQENYNID